MSLRDDLIEAGARALRDKTGIQVWDYETIATMDERAEAVLDAILDTLSAHTDEWCESSDDTKMLDRAIPVELIEALHV